MLITVLCSVCFAEWIHAYPLRIADRKILSLLKNVPRITNFRLNTTQLDGIVTFDFECKGDRPHLYIENIKLPANHDNLQQQRQTGQLVHAESLEFRCVVRNDFGIEVTYAVLYTVVVPNGKSYSLEFELATETYDADFHYCTFDSDHPQADRVCYNNMKDHLACGMFASPLYSPYNYYYWDGRKVESFPHEFHYQVYESEINVLFTNKTIVNFPNPAGYDSGPPKVEGLRFTLSKDKFRRNRGDLLLNCDGNNGLVDKLGIEYSFAPKNKLITQQASNELKLSVQKSALKDNQKSPEVFCTVGNNQSQKEIVSLTLSPTVTEKWFGSSKTTYFMVEFDFHMNATWLYVTTDVVGEQKRKVKLEHEGTTYDLMNIGAFGPMGQFAQRRFYNKFVRDVPTDKTTGTYRIFVGGDSRPVMEFSLTKKQVSLPVVIDAARQLIDSASDSVKKEPDIAKNRSSVVDSLPDNEITDSFVYKTPVLLLVPVDKSKNMFVSYYGDSISDGKNYLNVLLAVCTGLLLFSVILSIVRKISSLHPAKKCDVKDLPKVAMN